MGIEPAGVGGGGSWERGADSTGGVGGSSALQKQKDEEKGPEVENRQSA